jgi:hypothetical protein
MLGSWTPSEWLTVYAGIHTGWNNFTDPMPTAGRWTIVNPEAPGAGSTAGFLGGVVLANDDKSRTLAISTTSGNEVSPLGPPPADGSLVGNRSLVTTVFTAVLTEQLTYVFEHDAAWQFNAGVPPGNVGQPGGLAQWYSFNQYLVWRQAQAGCRSAAAIERAKNRMFGASVRRWGVGSPEPSDAQIVTR